MAAVNGVMPDMMMSEMTGGGGGALQEVERVRSVFPETWLWSNHTVGYLAFLLHL